MPSESIYIVKLFFLNQKEEEGQACLFLGFEEIIYIVQKDQPSGILSINENDNEGIKSSKLIKNAHLRENHQRNQIVQGLTDAQPDDLILISDVDEIPNLEIVNLKETKNKFIIFEQKIFYYKFNRILSGFIWYGTKACKMKFLKRKD